MRRYHCGRWISRTGLWQRQHSAVLDLDRGERRLAGVAPVDVAGAAIDQPGAPAASRNSHCDQRYMMRVGAEERALPVEREAEALELAGHVLGAAG